MMSVFTGSDNFTELVFSIQNGSHPSPPINPVISTISELRSEIQDVVMGFETRLWRIRRSGDVAFGSDTPEEEEEENDDEDDEHEKSEHDVVPGPEASILPILDASAPGEKPAPIIGRSQHEVEAAFARAEAQGNVAKGAKEAASRVGDDVETMATHDEL